MESSRKLLHELRKDEEEKRKKEFIPLLVFPSSVHPLIFILILFCVISSTNSFVFIIRKLTTTISTQSFLSILKNEI